MMSKSLIIKIFILVSLIFGFNIKTQAMVSSGPLNDIENKIRPASNSEGFLVVGKEDWENFKIGLENDFSRYSVKHDSLNSIIRQQSDSLMRLKEKRTIAPEVESFDFQPNVFIWILCGALIFLSLLAFAYVFNLKVKSNEAEERLQNLEGQYESSKRHWIDKERKFKRKLIDLNNRIEELEQDSTE